MAGVTMEASRVASLVTGAMEMRGDMEAASDVRCLFTSEHRPAFLILQDYFLSMVENPCPA
jgi:hypothetical protein